MIPEFLCKKLRINRRMPDDKGRPKTGGKCSTEINGVKMLDLPWFLYAFLCSCDFCSIAGNKIILDLLFGQFTDRRNDTESVAAKQNNRLRMSVD